MVKCTYLNQLVYRHEEENAARALHFLLFVSLQLGNFTVKGNAKSWEQVESEFNLYPLYEESEVMSEFDVRISSEFSLQLL